MLGDTHERIVVKALDCQPSWLQDILRPQWGWIQGGATLTDWARSYWQPDDSLGEGRSSLVHRCFFDSADPRDRGAISQIIRYIKGTISFIEEVREEPEGWEDRNEFHGQVALQLGILGHHIADLNTAVHVGHILDTELERITSKSKRDFHQYYERELEKYSRQVDLVSPREPRLLRIKMATFEAVARRTYEEVYCQLPKLYASREENESQIRALAQSCFVTAVEMTGDVWYTIATLANLTLNSP